MGLIIRIALMFFFIQFLVVVTITTVALLLARPEVPVLGHEYGRGAVSRSFAFVIHLPSQVLRSVLRLMRHRRFLPSGHE
ncbi:MAG: hypothetical protein ABSG32_17555 [Terriglobia bacterium]|jgi:hypothetical protein